jgi:hypothetical protein
MVFEVIIRSYAAGIDSALTRYIVLFEHKKVHHGKSNTL